MMRIKQNSDGAYTSFNLEGLSVGKLLAIERMCFETMRNNTMSIIGNEVYKVVSDALYEVMEKPRIVILPFKVVRQSDYKVLNPIIPDKELGLYKSLLHLQERDKVSIDEFIDFDIPLLNSTRFTFLK